MTTRLTRELMTFLHPFYLDEIEDDLPAGTYEIEIEQERIDGASFYAYRRTSTVLVVRPTSSNGLSRNRYINTAPASLKAALDRDLVRAGVEQTAWNREITAQSSDHTSRIIALPTGENVHRLKPAHQE